ncbi:hypothetical protein SAMN04487965_0426 [Microbulbifer donghaiensis]|uniref:Uncharacterized protein n=1 Tax=Microbulbifer donghaiensis TaxID=494016 RepID=A0A1M4VHM1_9GAMM|nr:AEC family transporter [Microbulbifer donghaiensis]SHE68342.1 hypothetical protein SAMN04487965_0426 [Microbulbifer donghaiensis]
MEILGLLVPIFAIIVTGIVFAHFKILPDGTADVLIQFAFWVAIPALLFSILAEESMKRLLDPGFYVSFGGAVAILFAIGFFYLRHWRHKSLGDATMLSVMGVFSNTAFVALPVLHSVFGHKAVLPAAIATVILIVVILVTTVLLERAQSTESGSSAGSGVLSGVRHALLNPVILSTLLGVAYAATGWSLPAVAKQYLSLLGAAVTPCALFAIGLSIKVEDIGKDLSAIVGVSLVKLIVLPVLVLLLAFLVDLTPIMTISAVVCAAVPVGKTTFVLATKYQQHPARVAAIISASSAASVITLLLWLLILAHMYPGTLSK